MGSFSTRSRADCRVFACSAAGIAGLLAAVLLAFAPSLVQAGVAEVVRERIEAIEAGQSLRIEGQALQAQRSLGKLYAGNGYRPYWDALRLQNLIEAIKDIEDDGLTPADYHLDALQRLAATAKSELQRAHLDLLASDAFALVLYHLYFGKVDPVSLDANWNFDSREIRKTDAVRYVHEAIRANRIRGSIERARPAHWMYAAATRHVRRPVELE